MVAALPHSYRFSLPADFQYVGLDSRPVEEQGEHQGMGRTSVLLLVGGLDAASRTCLQQRSQLPVVRVSPHAWPAAFQALAPPPAGLEQQQDVLLPGFAPQPLLCTPPLFAKQPVFDYGFRWGAAPGHALCVSPSAGHLLHANMHCSSEAGIAVFHGFMPALVRLGSYLGPSIKCAALAVPYPVVCG